MAYWHFIDLTELKINSLTVIRLSIGGNGIPLKWECRCDCGNTCIIPAARLRNWTAKSCGCIKRIGHNFIDLTGQKFGMLKVVLLHSKRKGVVKWNCICDCGKKSIVSTNHLRNGHTRSCGCYQLSQTSKAQFIDIAGQKFNFLTVISVHSRQNKRIMWNCLCGCGNATIVATCNIRNGAVKSCGCLGKDNLSRRTTHGMSHTALSVTLDNMKGRCYRPSTECYHNYGGRGIKICDEWLADTNNFYQWALLNGYKEGLTIERFDCDKDYCPENCTFIPFPEQSRNRRISLGVEKATEIKIKLKNGQSCVSISKEYNVEPSTISKINTGKAYAYIEI